MHVTKGSRQEALTTSCYAHNVMEGPCVRDSGQADKIG